jgi:16S rRNA (cytosine967-C5)-methyltransferase
VQGTLRYYYLLEPVVAACLDRGFRSKDLDLRCLLLVGAYQLYYLRIPDHAVVNETVNACRALRKPWARKLVNAVLRRLVETPAPDPSNHSFGCPEWIAHQVRDTYPDIAEEVLAATLERAPMSVRVNVRTITPETYARRLADQGITTSTGLVRENLVLDQPLPTALLPGYPEGLVSVQDPGAMFAAGLIRRNREPLRVLDACAAPGGKLFHLAEQFPDATIIGLDDSPVRLAHVREEATRLGHQRVILMVGDATQQSWHEGPGYDAILLDAPCSGSGTLRRHPDIKILRQPGDLVSYAEQQGKLLRNLWSLLAPGGALVYCTCSIFPEENDQVIDRFLAATNDALIDPLELPVGRRTRHGWQLLTLPSTSADLSFDGFFYARITRSEKAR